MSIARTGMCKNCYNNFQWGQKATGKSASYHDDCDHDHEIIELSFQQPDILISRGPANTAQPCQLRKVERPAFIGRIVA